MARAVQNMRSRLLVGLTAAIVCINVLVEPVNAATEYETLTGKLRKSGQFKTYLSILARSDEYRKSFMISLNNIPPFIGFTLLIPTDKAFAKYPGLTLKQQIQCIQFTTVSKRYTLQQLRAAPFGQTYFNTWGGASGNMLKRARQPNKNIVSYGGVQGKTLYATITRANVFIGTRSIAHGINSPIKPPYWL